jgi:hypothetical protein
MFIDKCLKYDFFQYDKCDEQQREGCHPVQDPGDLARVEDAC